MKNDQGNFDEPAPITVLYIGGYSRSGSTLLDMMLGQIEGFFSVGELDYLWTRGMIENQLCGCGQPFYDCAFWGGLAQEWLDDIGLTPAEVQQTHRALSRLRYVPWLLLPDRVQRWLGVYETRRRYEKIIEKLYRTIARGSGCRVVIDSSKNPVYAYLLSGIAGLDLRVIHLVRDSRAVAHSWTRRKRLLEVTDREMYMARKPTWRSAIEWNIHNGLFLFWRLWRREFRQSYLLVQYRQLATQPGAVLRQITAHFFGEGVIDLDFIDGTTITRRQQTHLVAGNPNRLKKEAYEVRYDDAWRKKMGFWDKILIQGLTWPLNGWFAGRKTQSIDTADAAPTAGPPGES